MTKPVLLLQFRADHDLEHDYTCTLSQTGLQPVIKNFIRLAYSN